MIYKALPITTLTLPHGLSYATIGAYFTNSGKLTQTITCSHPFHDQNYTAGPLTPKHTVLHLIRLNTVTQPNNTAILENFALHYIDLATVLTHIPYSYPYPYTRNIMQYNQYKSAGHTSAMRYSHARGLTAYSYTIQCHNTQEKDEINYNSPKKTGIKRSRSIATKLVQYLQTNVQLCRDFATDVSVELFTVFA